MKTYIIDDSRLARNEVRRLLEKIKDLEIVGEAQNVDEALQGIRSLSPDLLILDVQMPGKDGFDLLNELDQVPQVIFVTAYDEYAVKAFEVNALDYLTKPVDLNRLQTAVDKAKKQHEQLTHSKGRLSADSRVFVKDGERCWFVRVGDIYLFEADGNYTQIKFDEGAPRINKSLTYLEDRLDPEHFFRVNRSQIINLKKITSVDPWFSKSIKITLNDGTEVEASRRQTQQFRDLMSF
jgi:two-component system LytT family response regulator